MTPIFRVNLDTGEAEILKREFLPKMPPEGIKYLSLSDEAFVFEINATNESDLEELSTQILFELCSDLDKPYLQIVQETIYLKETNMDISKKVFTDITNGLANIAQGYRDHIDSCQGRIDAGTAGALAEVQVLVESKADHAMFLSEIEKFTAGLTAAIDEMQRPEPEPEQDTAG